MSPVSDAPAGPALIAHRGLAALAPENTLGAFATALDRGADGVELDVRAAADGTPVVCHDATVDRVTAATGAVADLTPADLAALSVAGGPDGVPTLAAALEATPPGATVYAELKEQGVAAAASDRLLASPHDVVVSSFDAAALATPRERGLATALLAVGDGLAAAEGKVPRTSNCEAASAAEGEVPRTSNREAVSAAEGEVPRISNREAVSAAERATDLGCAAVHLHATAVSAAVVEAAHDAGLDVAAWTLGPPAVEGGEWTVTDPAVVDRLRRLGVDALIADAPV